MHFLCSFTPGRNQNQGDRFAASRPRILNIALVVACFLILSYLYASTATLFSPSQEKEKKAEAGGDKSAVLNDWLGRPIDLSRLPPAVDRAVDFTTEIRPIFETACLPCHGPEKPKSGFRLDNREDALKGGDLGVAIYPGQSYKSPLIHYVARLVQSMEMPPQGREALTGAQVALLRGWIDQGAHWEEAEAASATPPSSDSGGTPAAASNEVTLPPPVKRTIDFVHEVGPLLAARCHSCHGPENQRGGLRLDVRESALKGGQSGPAILPGNSGESRLIRFVSGIPADMLMPRLGPRLTGEEIGLLRAWIDQGATWPDKYDPSQYSRNPADHWAYWPLRRPELPRVQNQPWPRTPIDYFILARLEEKGLRPSASADKRILLRRVTLDLTGLQPTPEEYREFLRDESAGAWEKVIDRLLSSPHYGERWARHWMDVVHYADSHGLEEDRPRDNSWPYRDYLIRSFNDDKPYARFIEEQLAGDVLYPNDPQATVATGFIGAGPFDNSAMTSLDESVDKKQAQNLDRDDMLMTTLSAFSSTTIHCARCHDHKFDPITQTEYYNLQSIFAGVDRGERPYDSDQKIHAVRQPLLQRKLTLEARQKELEEIATGIRAPEVEKLDERVKALEEELSARIKPMGDTVSRSLGYRSEIGFPGDAPKWVQIDFGQLLPIDQFFLVPVETAASGRGNDPKVGFGFPSRFRIDLSNDSQFALFQTVADHSGADFPHPGMLPYGVNAGGAKARYLRVTAFPPDKNSHWFFALSEIVVYSKGKNVAQGAAVTALDAIEGTPEGRSRWAKANLVDGYTSLVSLASLGLAEQSPSNGYQSEVAAQPESEKWVQVHLGRPVVVEEVRLIPAWPKGQHAGYAFPVRFKIAISDQADFKESRMLADYTATNFSNPEETPVVISGQFGRAHFVRVTATMLDSVPQGYAFALAEIQVLSGGENVAAGAVASALDSKESDGWSRAFLVDNYTSRHGIGELTEAHKRAVRRQEIELEIDRVKEERKTVARSLLDAAARAELEHIKQELDDIQKNLATLPPAEMVFAGTPDFAPFHRELFPTKGRPRPVFILQRGEITRPGQPAVPGGLSLVPGLNSKFQLEDPDNEGSRRAALAKWITDPQNVLTWRSIVNRVWYYHFDRGIVDTPNDFGHMGGRPSHPELLDWLATWFLENSGSLKKLHKLILMSSVYLQSSADNQKFSEIDAGNQYLWRMNRRRLDAESVRDSVLQASGKLDRTMGGPAVRWFTYEDPRPPVTPLLDYENFDVDAPESFRRSVYRYVFRTRTDPFMDTLDFPDASQLVATRNVSTTALQALSLWNNPFMIRQSQHLADRVTQEAGSDISDQIAAAYLLVFGREPTAQEAEALRAYAARHGMANACRVLFNSNEFMFVN